MADRTILSFELDEEMSARVAERLRAGGYASVGDYLRDLIRQDDQDLPELSEAELTELRQAFATPSVDCVYMTAGEVIERGRTRRAA